MDAAPPDERSQATVIDGRYRLLERVGEGGMGAVWHARDLRLGTDVAIKTVPERLAHDADFMRRLDQEAVALGRVRHPGVVAVRDLVHDGDAHHLVMDFVEGETLAARLARHPLEWAECVRVGQGVCDALEAVHAAGMIHRDLKPGNIMLTADGGVCVLDFGVARLPGSTLTLPGLRVGTPGYMAPETISGLRATPRSDLYSLGVTLFEAATGRTPFTGDTEGILYGHVAVPPPDPRPLAPALPPSASAVLLKALQKDPADRFASAAQMREALGTSVDPGAAGPPRTLAIPRPGRRAAAAGLAGAVALGVLIGLRLGQDVRRETARVQPVSAREVRLDVPRGWRRVSAVGTDLARLGLQPALNYVAAGDRSRGITVGLSDATGPTLLSDGFEGVVAGRLPSPTTVALTPRLQARRYLGVPLTTGRRVTVFVTPTRRGVLTIACFQPAGSTAAPDPCVASAASVRLRGRNQAYRLGPDPGYARALREAFATFNAADRTFSGRLRSADTRADQVAAADSARAAAHRLADTLARLTVSPEVSEHHGRLLSAARTLATELDALHAAGATGRADQWASVSSAITRARRELASRLSDMRALGYGVSGSSALP